MSCVTALGLNLKITPHSAPDQDFQEYTLGFVDGQAGRGVLNKCSPGSVEGGLSLKNAQEMLDHSKQSLCAEHEYQSTRSHHPCAGTARVLRRLLCASPMNTPHSWTLLDDSKQMIHAVAMLAALAQSRLQPRLLQPATQPASTAQPLLVPEA